mgnify:CR=1 FL=1
MCDIEPCTAADAPCAKMRKFKCDVDIFDNGKRMRNCSYFIQKRQAAAADGYISTPWYVFLETAFSQSSFRGREIAFFDEAHNIVLTMKGVGLRRLKEGIMSDISMNHISRLRGENDSTLRQLKEVSDCRIIVAENGRVWVDGDSDGITFMRTVLELVRNEGHMATFNASLEALIEERRNA